MAAQVSRVGDERQAPNPKASEFYTPLPSGSYAQYRGNLRAILLGCFEKDVRLVLVTGNTVTFKQHPLDGMINSRRLVDSRMCGRLGRDLTRNRSNCRGATLMKISMAYLTLVERLERF
jgi:hypothetical protein